MSRYFFPLWPWRPYLCKLAMPAAIRTAYCAHCKRTSGQYSEHMQDDGCCQSFSRFCIRRTSISELGSETRSRLRSTSTLLRVVAALTVARSGLCCTMGCVTPGLDIVLMITKRFHRETSRRVLCGLVQNLGITTQLVSDLANLHVKCRETNPSD